MINVTKTYLPKREAYLSYVDEIFESGIITNGGPLVKKLEQRLADHLGVKHVVLVANGTLALSVAYKALELKGEVITTPFSFIATATSISSVGLKPVFADIDPHTFNMNPGNIERLITDKTSAVVPVHVFGAPCELDAIKEVAEKYALKVIYDACHAFGVNVFSKNSSPYSVLKSGDISTLSFHATKIFHTIEGGAIITEDESLAEKIRLLINFGIDGPESIKLEGINAKMNEFEAAMGLCVLDNIGEIFSLREKVYNRYIAEFGTALQYQRQAINASKNFSYFPVLFDKETSLLRVLAELKDNDILPRRYFYPSLDTLPFFEHEDTCVVSRDISSRILCLPMYPTLSLGDQDSIIQIVKSAL